MTQTVLISGAATGIGLVMAKAFAQLGHQVHVCDASKKAVEGLSESDITASVADVSQPDQVAEVFDEVTQRYGGLDVLVNNAGIAGPSAPVESVDVEQWRQCVDIDLGGVFYMTRLAVPLLRHRGGGSIINISSTAGLFGFPLRTPYAASKWGVIGLTKTWAMELGDDNIRVNAICPGSVSGPRIDGVIERDAKQRGLSSAEVRKVYQKQSSMGVFVDPEDVANMAVFLSSKEARFVSGQVIAVDGHTESLSNWLD